MSRVEPPDEEGKAEVVGCASGCLGLILGAILGAILGGWSYQFERGDRGGGFGEIGIAFDATMRGGLIGAVVGAVGSFLFTFWIVKRKTRKAEG